MSETPETSNETPNETATETQEDPSVLGRLTPEEHQLLLQVRSESQPLLAKIGEHELLKSRILARLEELNSQGQEIMNAVSQRLGLKEGQTWVGLQDGTIRLVNSGSDGQTEEGGPSSG